MRIQIGGKRLKQRAIVGLNHVALDLQNKSFEIPVRLAVAVKRDGLGWVHGHEFGPRDAHYKLVQRLRDELQVESGPKELIENDDAKRYRLSVPRNTLRSTKPLSCKPSRASSRF
jgi:hypothetical protein